MKTHKHNTQKGFIALFFTLGISSILLAYVAASSASIFDFIRSRERFFDGREERVQLVQCADYGIDRMIRSRYVFTGVPQGCDISEPYISDIDRDTIDFSFKLGVLYIKGTIVQGLISDISYSSFSL